MLRARPQPIFNQGVDLGTGSIDWKGRRGTDRQFQNGRREIALMGAADLERAQSECMDNFRCARNQREGVAVQPRLRLQIADVQARRRVVLREIGRVGFAAGL